MRRTTGRQNRYGQNGDETWNVQPLNQNSPPGPPFSSSAKNYQNSTRQDHHSSKPRWRNQGEQMKFRFVKKSEVASSDSELGHVREKVESLNINDSQEVDEGNKGEGSELKSDLREERDQDGDSINDEEEEDDIQSRLDKLLMAVQEPELSEEQLRLNVQLQEDELLAMESIYGENVYNLDRWKGLRCLQIHIHIEILGEIAITARLNPSMELETKGNNMDDHLYSFKIQYLPPIILTCLLPKSYPSHQPPIFAISVQWLETIKISSLCSKLDSIWTEQQGQEVIYQWVEWLHGYSLSHLGFDKEIILGSGGMKNAIDKRAISGIVSLDVVIPSIRNYNNERQHENFRRDFHHCCICFSEYAGTEFVLLPCKHFFCTKCLQTYSDMHVKEGTVSNLQCPDAKCTVLIPPGLLKQLLGDEEFERWETLMLEKTLASMVDVAYCPRCETPCIEDEEQHAQCSKCFFSFCTLCRERRHVGIACMTLEMKLRILQERQNSSQLKEDQKHREREMINDMLSRIEIDRDSKQCPSCKMAISRTEGCNKMVCGNCGEYFCYRCNKALDKADPYGHFKDGSCELFPQEMLQTWQEHINHRQVVGQIQAELFPGRGQLCPSCRQFNAKMGNNNHMFCWACQSHYCYLCKKVVRRSNQHFGPKGCKQHTED